MKKENYVPVYARKSPVQKALRRNNSVAIGLPAPCIASPARRVGTPG